MHDTIDVSIIIVAYNNMSDVKNCIESIYRYNDIDDRLEIILVDHSEKTMIHNIKRIFPDIIALEHENLGFGSGNNFGREIAKGKILFFLNPDTILIECIFKKVIQAFCDNYSIGIIGLQLLDVNKKKEFSYYYIDKNSLFSKQKIKFANALSYFNEKKMYISGANMFIKKELFDKVGKFDENMFMYYEEADITKRIHEEGMTSKFIHDLHIIHLEGRCTNNELAVIKRKYKSASYYCKKYNLNYTKILKQDYLYTYLKYCVYRLVSSRNVKSTRERLGYILELMREHKT